MKRLGGVFPYLFHACVTIRTVVLDIWLLSACVADTAGGAATGGRDVDVDAVYVRCGAALTQFLLTITCAPLGGDWDCGGGHMR